MPDSADVFVLDDHGAGVTSVAFEDRHLLVVYPLPAWIEDVALEADRDGSHHSGSCLCVRGEGRSRWGQWRPGGYPGPLPVGRCAR